jgi:hypothetical protein
LLRLEGARPQGRIQRERMHVVSFYNRWNTAQPRYAPSGRVDVGRRRPSVNSAYRDHSGARNLQRGCHLPFAMIGPGRYAFEPQQNLPLAVPVEGELRSFRDFLRTVAHEFRIDGIKDIDPPGSWRLLI